MSGTISSARVTIDFLVGNTDTGFLQQHFIKQAEELNSPGVNGARWRTVYEQFPEFRLTTVTASTSVANAIELKRIIERDLAQENVTIKMVVNGVSYTMKKVHIVGSSAQVVPGPVYGAGAAGNAHVIATWQLKGTDFTV